MLWKWVSGHRLFNIGSNSCLGLNISNMKEPLEMLECDSPLYTLQWECSNGVLSGADHYTVAAENGNVVSRKQLKHTWKKYAGHEETFCEHYFQEVYSLHGNGLGKPCVFPFKYKDKWYHDCINKGREDGLYWCSTTTLYDRDQKWGFCPSSDMSSDILWEENKDTKTLYQFNLDSLLSWNEARASCQGQGGDLLSITDASEQKYIYKRLNGVTALLWTGLNQLDEATGWQWSDGAPVSLVNWASKSYKLAVAHSNAGKSKLSLELYDLNVHDHEERHCGVYDAAGNHTWYSVACHFELPYVCKKLIAPINYETFDAWKYYPTWCEFGWFPYNRYCYRLHREERSWKEASSICRINGSELMSMNSLADVECALNLLKNENVSEAWIGMNTNGNNPSIFQWSDGSSVTFTSWQKHEPIVSQEDSELCVSAQSTGGRWKLRKCTQKIFFICKKPGRIEAEPTNSLECQKNWERHGAYCYRIDDTYRTYQQASSGYYCASPLATITDRFEQAFITSLISSKLLTGDHFFWIALQDQNNTGEYTWQINSTHQPAVSFTNWNEHQPSKPGGCVTVLNKMGRWEVHDCRTSKAMSLCKKQLVSVIEEPSQSDRMDEDSDVCHAWDSEPHLDYCYKVYHHEKVLKKRTWQEAEEFCQDLGAHLVSFAHIEEETFVTQLLNNMFSQSNSRKFWIGLNKRNPSSGGTWEWSDGSSVVSPFLEDMYSTEDAQRCTGFREDGKVVPFYCDTKLEWICKIPKGVTPKNPEWHIKDVPWVFFQGNEYLFYDFNSEFSAFEFVCSWLGSHMLSIHSASEQAFIESRIKKISKKEKNWWIGLVYENSDHGMQRWKDLSPVIYQNWGIVPNQITSLYNRQCAYISSETGLWGYSDCFVPNPAICKTNEIRKIETVKYKHPVEDDDDKHGTCPVGWLYYGYKCFFVHEGEDGEELSDWFSARTFCSEHGGNLASVENEIEQAFIVMQLYGQTNSFWISLKSDDYRKWESGISETYSNWSPITSFQNNGNDTNEDSIEDDLCALISANHDFHLTGKWYLENCNRKGYGFVCEKEQAVSPHIINESDMFPVPDILEYGHKTYRLLSGNMTWYDATRMCQEYGAHMVSVTDQYHQAFLTIIVNRLGYSHWIGFFSPNNGRHFEWSDGSRSMFTAWEDEDSPSDGDCVYVDTDGYWRSEDCSAELQGAACLISNETKLPDYGGECQETWIKFQNYCYSVSTFLNSTNFYKAQEICEQQGSSLLTILQEEEQTFILQELGTFYSVDLWLNKIVFHTNGTVLWLDGTPVNYSNWGTRNPETDPLIRDMCVKLRMNDVIWQFTECTETRGFICKKHKDYRKPENRSSTTRTNHTVIPIVVIASVILSGLLLLLWYLFRQKKSSSFTLPIFQKLHCSHSNTEAAAGEESILITELEAQGDK
ncbi:secretory phospholipase A2 receptor [Rhinophrynus dorsalis]